MPRKSNLLTLCAAVFAAVVLLAVTGCQNVTSDEAPGNEQSQSANETRAGEGGDEKAESPQSSPTTEPTSLPSDIDTQTLELLKELRDSWVNTES